MPITLADLTSGRAETDIRIGDGTLHVVYRPAAISPAAFNHVLDIDQQLIGPDGGEPTMQQVRERVESAVDVLLPVLADWDLERPDADGKPSGQKIPITRYELSQIGLAILWAIVGGIFSEGRIDPKAQTSSPQGSPDMSGRAAGTSSGRRGSRPSPTGSSASK